MNRHVKMIVTSLILLFWACCQIVHALIFFVLLILPAILYGGVNWHTTTRRTTCVVRAPTSSFHPRRPRHLARPSLLAVPRCGCPRATLTWRARSWTLCARCKPTAWRSGVTQAGDQAYIPAG